MANPNRGSVALQVGDRAYTLSFSVNAVCELEDALDRPINKIIAMLNDPENVRMSTVRTLIWAGLIDHHPEMTTAEAGAVATEAGIPASMQAVGDALQLAFPQEDAKKGARPPKAAKRG